MKDIDKSVYEVNGEAIIKHLTFHKTWLDEHAHEASDGQIKYHMSELAYYRDLLSELPPERNIRNNGDVTLNSLLGTIPYQTNIKVMCDGSDWLDFTAMWDYNTQLEFVPQSVLDGVVMSISPTQNGTLQIEVMLSE